MQGLTEIAGLKIMAIAAESSTADSGAESGIPRLFDIDRRVYGEWGVRVFPSIVLVDSKGTVSKTNAGWSPGDRDDLRYELEVLTGARAREGVDSNLQILETGSEHDLSLRHFHAGKQLWDEGLQERAREAWMSALKADSLCLEARLYLGRYYLRLGDIDSAQAHFQVANANKPSAESLRLLAQCRIQTGDLRKAEEYLEDALDLNRRSSDSKLALAEVYLLQGDLEESRSMVDEVMAMTKDNPRGYYLLGRIAETEGDLPAALEQYRRALQILVLDR
jgi:tetratricopeptide (TPR) repeat protein